MSERQKHYLAVSLHLGDILSQLGISEVLRQKCKNSHSKVEALARLQSADLNLSVFICGSQIECSTTPGLLSDVDRILCQNKRPILHDLDEWIAGLDNHLMVNDEVTHPGYVKLQTVYNDVPEAMYNFRHDQIQVDHMGRCMHPNTCLPRIPYVTRQGPASSFSETKGGIAGDNVVAYPLRSFPRQAQEWITRDRHYGWPSEEFIRLLTQYKCLVVPVGHRFSAERHLEWRLSFSLQERSLMWSFNITQLRCYVTLKLILKSLIKPAVGESLSSYHCKTCLFHVIETTPKSLWCPPNLLLVVQLCLKTLCTWVDNGFCPMHFMPENNLFDTKIIGSVKRQLKRKLEELLSCHFSFLLRIQIDSIGQKVMDACSQLYHKEPEIEYGETEMKLIVELYYTVLLEVSKTRRYLLNNAHNSHISGETVISNLERILKQIGSHSSRSIAASEILPLMNNYIRFSIGSQFIALLHQAKEEAATAVSKVRYPSDSLEVISLFLVEDDPNEAAVTLQIGSDTVALLYPSGQFVVQPPCSVRSYLVNGTISPASSGYLKFAAMLLGQQDYAGTSRLLCTIFKSYEDYTESICGCSSRFEQHVGPAFINKIIYDNPTTKELVLNCASFCVICLPTEANNVPRSLRYEMFRSVAAEPGGRHEGKTSDDFWMDWMVIDSVTYVMYLNYLNCVGVFGRRSHHAIKALRYLALATKQKNLGHKETALNAMGDCCMRSGWMQQAYALLVRSIKTCTWTTERHDAKAKWYQHNAAKWHLARLLRMYYLSRK